MTEPKSRMAAMRQRALDAFAEGRTDDLTQFSTTALWEAARVEHRKGNRHALARVLVELFNRVDANDGTGVPIELQIVLPGMGASDTPSSARAPVSDTAVSDTPMPEPTHETIMAGFERIIADMDALDVELEAIGAELSARGIKVPALTLDPCPPPRTDAELIAILKADGWTQARIAHEIDRDQGRVSRALNRGAKLDDEAHDRLVGLVAEVERSSS